MKPKLTVLLLSITFLAQSQDIKELNGKFEDYNSDETKEYTFLQKHVMADFKFNLLGEIFSPETQIIRITDEFGSDIDTIQFEDRNLLINLAGVGIEPRVSLFSNQKFTIGLKGSAHLNLSLYTNFDNSYKGMGAFHFNSSGMLYFAKGLGSSYSNTEERGFSISGGAMFIKAPLVGGNSPYMQNDDHQLLPDSDEFLIDSWLLPAVQFDYYLLKQDFKMRNFSLTFSHFKGNTYVRFNYGLTLN